MLEKSLFQMLVDQHHMMLQKDNNNKYKFLGILQEMH